jgi:hypothetical protein
VLAEAAKVAVFLRIKGQDLVLMVVKRYGRFRISLHYFLEFGDVVATPRRSLCTHLPSGELRVAVWARADVQTAVPHYCACIWVKIHVRSWCACAGETAFFKVWYDAMDNEASASRCVAFGSDEAYISPVGVDISPVGVDAGYCFWTGRPVLPGADTPYLD